MFSIILELKWSLGQFGWMKKRYDHPTVSFSGRFRERLTALALFTPNESLDKERPKNFQLDSIYVTCAPPIFFRTSVSSK